MNATAERRRDLIGGAVATVLVLGAVFLMPRGLAIGAVFINGLLAGLLYAITAVGMILIYRSSRVINFAQISLGGVGSTTAYYLNTRYDVPFFLAVAAGIVVAPVLGGLIDLLIMQRFTKSPRLVATVATLGLVPLLGELIRRVIDFLEKEDLEGRQNLPFNFPFKGSKLDINGFVFDVRHLTVLVLCSVALIGLAAFLRRSRLGIAVRGASENADRAALLGVPVMLVSVTVWAIAATLSTIAATTGGAIGLVDQRSISVEALMPALAAAVLARMVSMPLAVLAGLLIGVLDRGLSWSYGQNPYIQLVLFAVIIVGLLLQRKLVTGGEQDGANTFRAAREARPVPAELLAISGVRRARQAMVALTVIAALGVPWLLDAGQVNLSSFTAILAIMTVSLVILTGWAGQISLGHFAIVAATGFIGGIATTTWGLSFWLALPLGAVAGALIAFLIGLPALRVKGLFLAVSTFALSVATPLVLFDEDLLGRYAPTTVDRPKLLFIDFQRSERAYYYLTLAFLVMTLLVAQGLRRSRTGRVLIALRDNESGTQSFGVDVMRARITAFMISGFFAGLAGVLYVHHQFGAVATSFEPERSVNLFVGVVVGGMASLSGGVLAAIYFGVLIGYLLPRNLVGLAQSISVIGVLILFPGGLTQLLYGARDAVLRIVALRNRVVVPSLFGESEVADWDDRRAPLAPTGRGGLATLRPGQKYRLPSRLWGRPV
ncbi:MAG: branched-chain amino acid transport system permease protein livM [Actinomycetota bacterium]|jgi:branched-chain amino acid transport system permease protein